MDEGRDQSRSGRVLGTDGQGRTLRKTSSDSDCITLNKSVTRLLHVILVGLWNWRERCDDWHK